MTTYEKINYITTLIEAAKGMDVPSTIKADIEYRGRKGHIKVTTLGAFDLVIGDVVATHYEIYDYDQDAMYVYAWDKMLDRVTKATIYHDEITSEGLPINIQQHKKVD